MAKKQFNIRNFHISFVPQHITHNWNGKQIHIGVPQPKTCKITNRKMRRLWGK